MAASNINNIDYYFGDNDINDDILSSMRTAYYKKLATSYKNEFRQGFMCNVASQDFVNIVMQKLQNEKIEKYPDQMALSINPKDFKIVVIDGKERLVKKILGQNKIIVPWEDSFEIVWAGHMEFRHPAPKELINLFNNKYLVNRNAIECITSICPVCVGENRPNVRFVLHFVPMTLDPVSKFKNILAYEDCITEFIHLIPINEGLTTHELAKEIIKIFCLYGQARKLLLSHPILIQTFADITELKNFDVIVKKVEVDSVKIGLIRSKIDKWMIENQRKDWGCSILIIERDINGKNCVSEHNENATAATLQNVTLPDINIQEYMDLSEFILNDPLPFDGNIFDHNILESNELFENANLKNTEFEEGTYRQILDAQSLQSQYLEEVSTKDKPGTSCQDLGAYAIDPMEEDNPFELLELFPEGSEYF